MNAATLSPRDKTTGERKPWFNVPPLSFRASARISAYARKDRCDFRSRRGLSRLLHRSSVFPNKRPDATLRKRTKIKRLDINNLSWRWFRGAARQRDVGGARCIKYEIQYKLFERHKPRASTWPPSSRPSVFAFLFFSFLFFYNAKQSVKI